MTCCDRLQSRHAAIKYIQESRHHLSVQLPMEQVLPQSHLGTARRYPHLGECTLPLHTLAVACTMRNEALRTLRERYGALQNVMEVLQIVTGRYETLQSIAERYGTLGLQKRRGSFTRCFQALRNIMEHCWTLRNVTEPLRKISIFPISN